MRSSDGGSLYVRNVFQMRVDAHAAYDSFGLNVHVAHRFVDAINRTYPSLSREEAIWYYEFARGVAIHIFANLDPTSLRFGLLALEDGEALSDAPAFELGTAHVERIIGTILRGWPPT